MGWERKILFGYRMEQTRIVREDTEAEIVKMIFERYLNGESLAQLANTLSGQNVRYHAHTPAWNKNMIKRIIEDNRYIGCEDYPKIVDKELFLAVRLLKAEKAKPICPCPELIKPLRGRITCAVCGSIMRRHPSNKRKIRWICQNKECRETAIIQDEEMIDGIGQCLAKLTQSPQLLTVTEAKTTIPGKDALRLENELTAAFNRGTESLEYMITLIFALASERYNAIPDISVEYEAKKLQKKIADQTIDLDTLIRKAVRRVLLRRRAGVAIELINGVVITYRQEEVQ